MTFSGFGDADVMPTAANLDDTTNLATNALLDNSLLLCIILGVCCLIFIVLLCMVILVFCIKFCRKSKKGLRRCEQTQCFSKSTSTTGLSSTLVDSNANENLGLQVVLQKNGSSKTLLEHEKVDSKWNSDKEDVAINKAKTLLVTSTPAVKSGGGSSGTLVLSPQSIISGSAIAQPNSVTKPEELCLKTLKTLHNTQHCDLKLGTSSYYVTSPLSSDGTHWVTTHDTVSSLAKLPISSNYMYGTADSNLLDPYLCAENLQADFDALAEVDINNEEDHKNQDERSFPVSIASSQSLVSPDGVTSSLPLDAYGHPRAWFVPLDEIYHEPLRHSFIDVSNEQDPLLHCQEHNHPGKTKLIKSSQLDRNADEQILSDGSPESDSVFRDKSLQSKDWRDSGIPTSRSNLRRSNSSEIDGRKLSLWEQREDRPVVFLDPSVRVPVSPVGED
ncbi:uncharacterized protein LOC143460317 [Clavelina lepadiformis]|uniref:Uncharacterized protein n=1 Tax=Clavelina lepadiformis TaxID=159417 RepID=A0ABP0FWM6_CLALP